ncbi:hypothetical protein [Streptomyces sp. NPDC003032]
MRSYNGRARPPVGCCAANQRRHGGIAMRQRDSPLVTLERPQPGVVERKDRVTRTRTLAPQPELLQQPAQGRARRAPGEGA